MNTTGLPDLLSAGRLSRDLARVNADFERAAGEVSSGLKSDIVEASGGDPTRLYALERDLTLVERRQTTIGLAAGRAGVSQSALGRVQDSVGAVGVALSAAVARGDESAAAAEAGKARSAFGEAVSALNSRFGDRALFAGAAADGPALASPDVILDEIAALVAAAPDAAGAVAAVDAYFADPAGFGATGYLGSADDAPDAEIADGARVSYALRADRRELTDALAALALGVVGAEGGFGGDGGAARLEVLGVAAGRGIAAGDGVIALRGALGATEERLEEAGVRADAERSLLQRTRSGILARDPFEAATAFKALETQLQSIFSVTARLSSLSLSNFLR